MHRSTGLHALAASVVAFGAVTADADVTPYLDVNFDSTTSNNAFGHGYGGITWSGGVAEGVGVNDSIGLRMYVNSTDAGDSWGPIIEVEQFATAPTLPATMSDLLYSLDYIAAGFNASVVSGNVQVRVRIRQGTTTLLQVNKLHAYDAQLGGWQTFAGDLSTGDAATDDANLAALLNGQGPLEVRYRLEFQGASSRFGKDDDNYFGVDNLVVGVVPEPASLALLGVGGLIAMRRRR